MSSTSASEPILTVEELRTYFLSREGTLKAVDGVSFDVRKGEVVGLVGESGCGKSVTAQSLLRITPRNGKIVGGRILFSAENGVVDLAALDPRGPEIRRLRGRELSMIFQEPMTSFSPVYTIGNQIAEAFTLHQKITEREAWQKSIELLRRVRMPRPEQQMQSYSFSLSGGMRQRALIAMALACGPRLVVADEPTTALDVTIQAQIMRLLKELQREMGMAVILITHDLGLVAQLCDRIGIMYLGWIVEHASADEIFHEPLHPYTRGLLSSIPTIGRNARREIVPISGSVPSLYEKPQGCFFHPRCPQFVAGVCDRVEPADVEVSKGHRVKCVLYQGSAGNGSREGGRHA